MDRELTLLKVRLQSANLTIPPDHIQELGVVNRRLWDVEEHLRRHEKIQLFDARFIELARMVYQLNDQRSNLKRQINQACGSSLLEEKNYRTGSPTPESDTTAPW